MIRVIGGKFKTKYQLNLIQGKWREIQNEIPTVPDSGKMAGNAKQGTTKLRWVLGNWGTDVSTASRWETKETNLAGYKKTRKLCDVRKL